MKCLVASVVLASCALAPTPEAFGQSYNIDFGDPGSGPAATYPGAGLPGVWNVIGVPTPGTYYPLASLQGQNLGVELNNLGGTQVLNANDPLTAGDHEKLVDDMLIGFNNPVDVCIWVRNLVPGPYEVLIHAITPNDAATLNRTRVDFAAQGPIWIGGTFPGQHQLNVTYSRFTVTTNDGVIGLHSGVYNGNIQSGINGIQIRRIHTGDTNGDALVNIDDLLTVINGWGRCPADPPLCASDVNGNGIVDIDDLLSVINHWG